MSVFEFNKNNLKLPALISRAATNFEDPGPKFLQGIRMIASVSTGISSPNVLAAARSAGAEKVVFETADVKTESTQPVAGARTAAIQRPEVWTRFYEGMVSVFEGEQKRSEDTSVIDYYSQSVRDLTEQLEVASGSARVQLSSDLQAAQEGLLQARENKAAELESFAEKRQWMEPFLEKLAQNMSAFYSHADIFSAAPELDAKL